MNTPEFQHYFLQKNSFSNKKQNLYFIQVNWFYNVMTSPSFRSDDDS